MRGGDVGEPTGVVTGGLDLGQVGDLAAFARCWMKGDILHLTCATWIPEDTLEERGKRDKKPYGKWVEDGWLRTTEGAATDFVQVRDDILGMHEDYALTDMGYDQWMAAKLAEKIEAVSDLKCVDVPQRTSALNEATRDFKQRILSRRLVHDGNPVLRMAVQNVVEVKDSNGYIKPDKRKSTGRIDPVTGSVIAIDRQIRQEQVVVRQPMTAQPVTTTPREERESRMQW